MVAPPSPLVSLSKCFDFMFSGGGGKKRSGDYTDPWELRLALVAPFEPERVSSSLHNAIARERRSAKQGSAEKDSRPLETTPLNVQD